MSRIGRMPVEIPAGVTATLNGNTLTVKGPLGTLTETFRPEINIAIEGNQIIVTRNSDEKEERSLHGLTRALINNMVVGVTKGYQKVLMIIGVGYKAEKKGNTLVMNLGYSHPVEMVDPEGITTEVPSATEIVVKGADKAIVGNYAANIRAWRKPEPYKGKGIKYADETIRRKVGKTGKK